MISLLRTIAAVIGVLAVLAIFFLYIDPGGVWLVQTVEVAKRIAILVILAVIGLFFVDIAIKRLWPRRKRAVFFDLGVKHAAGKGVPQDYVQAANWYRKAADRGLAAAQWSLGNLYRSGEGVPQNDAEALKWYRKAADQGNVGALLALGNMYSGLVDRSYGRLAGVPQDYVLAHAYYSLTLARLSAAGEALRSPTLEDRDEIAAKMTPAQIAEAQKLVREWRPSK